MLKEIQRHVLLFVLFYTLICAQDVQNVGAHINVKDRFPKADVDPFASFTTNTKTDNSDTKKVTITETSNQKKDDGKKPVVAGSDVGTRTDTTNAKVQTGVNTGTGSSSTTTKQKTSSNTAQRKTRIVGSGKGTIRETSNVKPQNPETNKLTSKPTNVGGRRTEQNSLPRDDTRTGQGKRRGPPSGSARNVGVFSNDRMEGFGTGRRSGIGMDMTTTDKPIQFLRKLYTDQSICDICSGGETDCYLEHPEDCRKYIRCSTSSAGGRMEALEMNCAFGTFWSDIANTCDVASDVYCSRDKCRDANRRSYSSGLNCRSYWRCVNGRSHAECCPVNEAFVNGACVPSDSCKIDEDECPYTNRIIESAQEKKPSCQLEVVPEDERAFKNHGSILYCADGTKFDLETCGCIKSQFVRSRCKATADLDFQGDEIRNLGKNYMEPTNVTVISKASSYARFTGKSSIAVPYFKNNENIGSHFVIRIRFYKEDTKGYDSQVLASNCKTKAATELSPSFAILLSQKKQQIIFFASTKKDDNKRYGATESIALPYTPGKWTVVELKFLDEVLYAEVKTLERDGQSNVESRQKVLKGTLTTSVMPLMIGNCNMNDGFVGYIDQMKAYLCKPDQV